MGNETNGGSAFAAGQRVRLRVQGKPDFAVVKYVIPGTPAGVFNLVLQGEDGGMFDVVVTSYSGDSVRVLSDDGGANSERVLAGMWTRWMVAASTNAESSAIVTTPLRPYAHQATAVYGAMLPQPMLRFLLADEPGTGKTIMAGLYIREMQRRGLLKRALVVCPANLASKWIADFERFLGGGLRHLKAATVQEGAVAHHDLWVVSLELAAMNPQVQEAISPDKAGWDLVVFDEAHRLTPTATTFHQVGRLLARNTPRALLMTATPHRGQEWLFRHLLHLVDSDIYPDPGPDPTTLLSALRPGPIHFLRRMKEDLVDYDGKTRLFKDRTAFNQKVPLSSTEFAYYQAALDMVDDFFPSAAAPLASMVYGKRAASSLFALKETLLRRQINMGAMSEVEAAANAYRNDPGDEGAADEARVTNAASKASQRERSGLRTLIESITKTLSDPDWQPSKWVRLTEDCLAAHGILPGTDEQAVVFTEYTDTAEWVADRLRKSGYSAKVYSGSLSNDLRDQVRRDFMNCKYQIIVTTDAGNEGIDLQAAHILINYDIPWSLVRLEQRMGRIHRVGQSHDVYLYNLVATDTREGKTLLTLLENFVTAANELGGQMFDSLSAVAELTGVDFDKWLTDTFGADQAKREAAMSAAAAVNAHDLIRKAKEIKRAEQKLASQVDAVAALTLLQRDLFARINPAIVEAYLDRLSAARFLAAKPTTAGPGFRLLSLTHGKLPESLGGKDHAHVATSGEAIRNAEGVDTHGIITLGPGEPGFTDLIEMAGRYFAEDTHRSGAVEDPSSLTPYDLYSFEATLIEADGKRASVWASLIKVDDSGDARAVRWETLANLVATQKDGTSPNLARLDAATVAANAIGQETISQHRKGRLEWFAQARKDLEDLPLKLSEGIKDKQQRLDMRKHLKSQTASRLAQLEALADVDLTVPKLTGRLRVHAAGTKEIQFEADSEWVAMAHVQKLLEEDGWTVQDVHTEGRGYDLEARRHAQLRSVEVKGVWESAASNGVRMTGNEVLMATQHGAKYWLYVIDNCSGGVGRFFGAYEDPAALFKTDMVGDAIFRVPGSILQQAPGSQL